MCVFRSDIRVLMRMFAKLCASFSVFLFFAAAIGQWRVGRFPAYFDLLLAPVLPFVLFAVMWFLGELAALIFPVKIFQHGLRCYDQTGRYRTIEWARIHDVQTGNIYGLPYLFVYGGDLSRPLTVPLWLKNMKEFRAAVERVASKDNMLVKALGEAT